MAGNRAATAKQRWRDLRARVVYRLDQLLSLPPLGQLAALFALTAVAIAGVAALELLVHPRDSGVPNTSEALWWSVTHFMDGGTMVGDPTYRRGLALFATVAGILVLSLLTAAFASKMGERIAVMREGMSPVIERGHVLVLGFDAKVPLLARELARSRQRVTLVVLAPDDKDRIDLALRPAKRIGGRRLRTVVRTGDPRAELALLRVSAQHARAVVIVPPSEGDDAEAVRFAMSTLLAMRRVAEDGFSGRVIVEARHAEAEELLSLAAEAETAGPGALPLEVVATDAVIAGLLAQSTREEGIYAVLRHLFAFDGCEIYALPVPHALVGARFDDAHAALTASVLIGLQRAGASDRVLCPPHGAEIVLAKDDRLYVLADGPHALGVDAAARHAKVDLPPGADPAPKAERVAVLGYGSTLPHLVRELAAVLPEGSSVRVLAGEHEAAARDAIADLHTGRVRVELDPRSPTALAHRGHEALCAADAVVILGEEDDSDEQGDASALAMLLRMRHGMRKSGGTPRLVTEVRDPRSAAHVVPRRGDCIVSADVVAMLLAQVVLDAEVAPVYRDLLAPGGVAVTMRARARYARGKATFGDIAAAARARGEIALGFHPDPRAQGDRAELARQRLEEGEAPETERPWLSPPRDTEVPDRDDIQIVMLACEPPRPERRLERPSERSSIPPEIEPEAMG